MIFGEKFVWRLDAPKNTIKKLEQPNEDGHSP